MEILINELSLTGQFKDENSFFDDFDSILKIIKIIDILNFSLAKEYMFFNVNITPKYKLNDFLRLRTDRARKLKRFLSKLAQTPPYWNEIQKHNCRNTTYTYNSYDVCNTSLAESCERDRIILSFKHNHFLDENLEIQKNSSSINIYNLINRDDFLDYLLATSQIEPINYCQFKFEGSNLDFSLIQEGYGFDSLTSTQQINEFIEGFKEFSKMSWQEISQSDGLEYKPYTKPKKKKILGWFREGLYKNTEIKKFRITQKYRCFGYREDDTFFVLRFEIDHKISDNG